MTLPNGNKRSSNATFHRHLSEQQWREQVSTPPGHYIGLWCDDDNAYHLCWDHQKPTLYSTPLIDRRYFALSRTSRAASMAERMAFELWGAMPLDALSDEPFLDHEKWLSVWPLSRRALPAAIPSQPDGPLDAAPSRPGSVKKSPSGLRVGRSHRGLHKRLLEKPIDEALSMVGKLAAGETVSAALAMAQALEALYSIKIPPQRRDERLILAEIERIRVHLESIIDVARLTQQDLLETHAALILRQCDQTCAQHGGGLHMIGCIMLGGISAEIEVAALTEAIMAAISPRLPLLGQLITNAGSVMLRRNIVTRHRAETYSIRGVNGRASGHQGDLRLLYRDPRLEIRFDNLDQRGDARARLWNRYLEISDSLAYLHVLRHHFGRDFPFYELVVHDADEAISGVEGPRGETWCWVKCQEDRLTHFHIQTGSFNTLPLLLELNLAGEDEQFLNASFAHSSASAEL